MIVDSIHRNEKKLKYFFHFLRNTSPRTTKQQEQNMMTFMKSFNEEQQHGLTRMDDAEYEAEFTTTPLDAGTPRPGTSDADNEAAAYAAARAIQVWSFSQAANQHAAAVKRRRTPISRTIYRMGANTHVKDALAHLKKKLDETREVRHLTPHLSEEDFKLLKQGIENFRVKIVMDDSITFDELCQMRDANRNELSKMQNELQESYKLHGSCHPSYIEAKNKYADMMEWNSALTVEIIRVRQTKGTTPSQHAQISQNDSGVALRNVIAPETIRCKFTSLNNLTKRIRQELVAFLTADARVDDRVNVVKQIKESCIARKSSSKKCA